MIVRAIEQNNDLIQKKIISLKIFAAQIWNSLTLLKAGQPKLLRGPHLIKMAPNNYDLDRIWNKTEQKNTQNMGKNILRKTLKQRRPTRGP
jgi:hypothetical protein